MIPFLAGLGVGLAAGALGGSWLSCRLWLRARQAHAQSLLLTSRGLRGLLGEKS